jgi:catechol 2,3-dioxygenase-like lactoylglutathione lyase family enzyme
MKFRFIQTKIAVISISIILMLTTKTQGQEIQPSPVWGIAKMTFLVSDFELARDYYGKFLGFDEAFSYQSDRGKIISFKMNDRQFLEFIEDSLAKDKNRLVSVSLETDSVEQMRLYLQSQGVKVSPAISLDGAGNKTFLVYDPSGIPVELILFHPYGEGHWGFDRMKDEEDDFYLRYLIARLSAFRNIWWSLGNEYDLMDGKTTEDWDRFFQILQSEDPYGHPRSVHNWRTWYDYTKPWVTHLSLQASPGKVREWREKYKKPVIIDEFGYEGNIRYSWGDPTAEECTRRF